jgi:hypothetical protein
MGGGGGDETDDAFYSPPDRGDGAKTVDEIERNPETALIPKSICGDASYREGDEITLRIVKDHGDEYEVAHSEKPEKEEEPAGEPSGGPPIPDDNQMAAMNQG